jgi:hypothetical protein
MLFINTFVEISHHSIFVPLAYLDPGTGSLILQMLIGIVLGGMVIFRNSFGNLLYMLGIRKNKTEDSADKDSDISDIEEVNTDEGQ